MPQTTAVGIDVSKAKLDVCVLSNRGQYNSTFKNNSKGIDLLRSFLKEKKVRRKDQIVIESTGDYHLLVSSKLYNAGLNTQIINPLITKQKINANIRKVKSDKADAKVLAEIARDSVLNNHSFSTQELLKRKIVAQINAVEKHKAALKLSVKNMRNVLNDFSLEMNGIDAVERIIKDLNKAVESMQEQLKSITVKKDLVKSISEVKGISENTATVVVSLIEDREFKSKGALVAYSGLDVSVKESGMWRGKTKLTKRGNPLLRKYLVQIGWGLLMHNEKFQKYIEEFKKRGRKYKELLVIMARKFVRMLYAALKKDIFSLDFV
jgi:transposase